MLLGRLSAAFFGNRDNIPTILPKCQIRAYVYIIIANIAHANNFTCKTAAFAVLESSFTSTTLWFNLVICAFISAFFFAMVCHFWCNNFAEVITRHILWLVRVVCVVKEHRSFLSFSPGAVSGGSVCSNCVH